MNPSYDDITGRIAEPPSWWQEGGVPRWGEYSPREVSSIYAREAVLMEVACQGCDTVFRVAMCEDGHGGGPRIAEQIASNRLHYGDPPNTGCCSSGASMNSVPLRIVEYWSTHDPQYVKDGVVADVEKYFEWTRDASLEGRYDGWNAPRRPPAI